VEKRDKLQIIFIPAISWTLDFIQALFWTLSIVWGIFKINQKVDLNVYL
jgi:hypothetical protein